MNKTGNIIIAVCFDTYDGLKLNITKPCQYELVSKEGHVYDLTLHINEHRC